MDSNKKVNPLCNVFNDPRLNRYDTGPGSFLPDDLQPGALLSQSNTTNRKSVGVYLKNISVNLKEDGIRNLCGKFGRVLDVKWYGSQQGRYNTNRALVIFGTTSDAENCVRRVNESEIGISAEFQRHAEKADECNKPIDLPMFDTVEHKIRKMQGLFSKPNVSGLFRKKTLITYDDYLAGSMLVLWDPRYDFVNQCPNNLILGRSNNPKYDLIVNGRFVYKHSADVLSKMNKLHIESRGILDEEQCEFVYNGSTTLPKTDNCKNCGNITMTFCKVCYEFYCSFQCWSTSTGCKCQNLKSIEGSESHVENTNESNLPINRMVLNTQCPEVDPIKPRSINEKRLKALMKSRKLKINQQKRTVPPCEPPSNNTLVAITTVLSHRCLYLRLRDEEDEYIKYLNDIAESSKTAVPLWHIPLVGDIVLAESEGTYYRAVVLDTKFDLAVVVYLDFGNIDEKPFGELKQLRDVLKYQKRFIFKAYLKDVDESLMSDKCLLYLYNLLEGDASLKFIRNEDTSANSVSCELIVNERNENVSRMVNRFNCLKIGNAYVNYSDIFLTALEGENIPLIVVDNSTIKDGSITVVKKQHLIQLQSMQERIAAYCKEESTSPYTPRNYEVCLAKGNDNDDNWYRAYLVESVGDGNPIIMFIDFGNVDQVNVYNMRQMPLEFAYPCYSVYAEIGAVSDPQALTDNQIHELEDYFAVGAEIIADKIEVKKGKALDNDDITILYFKDLKMGC